MSRPNGLARVPGPKWLGWGKKEKGSRFARKGSLISTLESSALSYAAGLYRCQLRRNLIHHTFDRRFHPA